MNINYLGIILCTVFNIVWARIWYGLFFKDLWLKLTHRSAAEKPDRLQMSVAVFFAFVMSLGINILISLLAINTLALGLFVGLILGLLFVAPIVLGEWIWDKKNFELVTINATFYISYLVLSFLIFIALA